MKLWLKRFILRLLFADIATFINGIYASVPRPSYYIKLPDMPTNIQKLLK